MKNILQEVLSKLNIQKALDSLADHLPAKIVGSVVISSLADIGTLLMLFCGLEFLDLFTKWISLSHDYWANTYGKEFTQKYGCLWSYIKWLPECRRFKYINSSAMKNQFTSKMLTYTILILTTCWADVCIKKVGGVAFISTIGISMISLAESLSIVENLSSANIGIADSIKGILQKKKDSMKG
jgi:hypothetical protein